MSSLASRLAHQIRADGPIPFARFMEAALYDANEGFYSRNPVGRGGDFVTGPHLSEAFATLLARQIHEFWDLLGAPPRFSIIEVGAGDGTLARQLLSLLPRGLKQATRYVAVERSEAARARLQALDVAAFSSLVEVSPVPEGCVVANELLDNLPFHWIRQTRDGLVELHVGLADGDFRLEEAQVSSPAVASMGPSLQPGQEALVRPEALGFIDESARVLARGYVWVADYASSDANQPPSVHAYLRHRVVEDVLSAPGSRDITSGVDFDALLRHARSRGLAVWGPVSQRDALYALGFREWDAQQRQRQVQAMDAGRGLEATSIYSQRNSASILVDPALMGGFKVLCLGIRTDSAPLSVAARGR